MTFLAVFDNKRVIIRRLASPYYTAKRTNITSFYVSIPSVNLNHRVNHRLKNYRLNHRPIIV
jgi:hypothetical protein